MTAYDGIPAIEQLKFGVLLMTQEDKHEQNRSVVLSKITAPIREAAKLTERQGTHMVIAQEGKKADVDSPPDHVI